MTTRRTFLQIGGGAAVLALGACSSNDPLANPTTVAGTATPPAGGSTTLVVGSQQYYSNEIVAEIYAQALEKAGFTVTRNFQIGQREVYLPEIKAGKIDVFPEYTGNFLQALDKSATAKTLAEVEVAITKALPSGLKVLKAAGASDQDSYNVTRATADKYGLASLADLTKVKEPITIGGNAELSSRPYGPQGLKKEYGVDATVIPVEDSGGPLTRKALTDGKVFMVDLYSADPSIASSGFVTLTDPRSMILPQNVIPVVSAKVDAKATAAIEKVQAALDASTLPRLNAQSKDQQKKSADIAKAWLAEKGL